MQQDTAQFYSPNERQLILGLQRSPSGGLSSFLGVQREYMGLDASGNTVQT